jgi:hypothetical protein
MHRLKPLFIDNILYIYILQYFEKSFFLIFLEKYLFKNKERQAALIRKI